MNRTYTTLHSFVLFLGLSIMPAFLGAIISCAEEHQGEVSTLNGFAEHVKTKNISPVSICFANAEGGDATWATLEWGKTMLGELKRHLMVPENKRFESIEDILAFRDWCMGAPGGGNLTLAISAEEVHNA